MNRRWRGPSVVAVCGLVSLACAGGTWTDDRDAWWWALGEPLPDDVVLIHGIYVQSAHWTDEHNFFFVLAPNDALWQALTSRPGAVAGGVPAPNPCLLGAVPAWFSLDPGRAYQVWDLDTQVQAIRDQGDGTIRVWGCAI